MNLTLASPAVNRHQKSGKDAAEWMPGLNQCWFANQVLQARVAYGLTIDRAEADALERVLAGCSSTEMVFTARAATTVTMTPTPDPAAVYASCEAAEAAGAPRIQGQMAAVRDSRRQRYRAPATAMAMGWFVSGRPTKRKVTH